MKLIFRTLLLSLMTTFFISCGGEKIVDHTEWLVGDWELKNAGELQRFLTDKKSYLLKNATISFADNGTVVSKLMKLDKKSWIEQTGTWEMPIAGDKLTIKSNNGPFNDELEVEFPNQRTLFIKSNKLIYHFVKL